MFRYTTIVKHVGSLLSIRICYILGSGILFLLIVLYLTILVLTCEDPLYPVYYIRIPYTMWILALPRWPSRLDCHSNKFGSILQPLSGARQCTTITNRYTYKDLDFIFWFRHKYRNIPWPVGTIVYIYYTLLDSTTSILWSIFIHITVRFSSNILYILSLQVFLHDVMDLIVLIRELALQAIHHLS